MGIVIYNISIVRIVTLYVYIYIILLYLVGGWPTPLQNDGVRQLGWWNSQYVEKKTCSEPTTSIGVFKVFMVI